MSIDTAAVATAFSSHRFEETFDALAPDAIWNAVGQSVIEGRDAIVETCRAAAAEFETTSTEFTRFVTVAGTDAVAVDAIARYTDSDGSVSIVSSCDIYEFAGDLLTMITSYAVELPA
jgi:SnoaL-like protein